MPPSRPPLARCARLAVATALAALASPLAAQRPGTEAIPLPGSETEIALRLGHLQGAVDPDGYLLRTLGSRIRALSAGQDTAILLRPEFTYGYNSGHAWGFNDGPLRAGRGASWMLSTGFATRIRRVTVVIAPQFVHEANLPFQTIPYPQPTPPERNVWANPFYPFPTSADYPQRFGDEARTKLDVQFRLAVDAHRLVRVGASTENRWWGPSVRNGLLLTANAPGFEHLFVETPGPIATRYGDVDAQLLFGKLRESAFFDFDASNDERSLSALAVTWRAPEGAGAWPTLGIARAVMANGAPGIGNVLDFGRNVGPVYSDPDEAAKGYEQILVLFSRWLFPAVGAEAYVEWARYEQPVSPRDFLEAPGHSQGYTMGAQWAAPWREGTVHLQAELSYLEPSASIRVRPVSTSYTSAGVAHGWTHEGQMLGPAIGPGASSQWLAADLRLDRWRTGLSLGRYRRDANYRFLNPLPPKREDLSLYASIRYGRRIGAFDALVEFTNGVRLNHLYQAYEFGTPDGRTEGVDLLNRTLTVTLTPHLPRLVRGAAPDR